MQNELTLDQITWLNVSGSREVKRLPSHFIRIIYSFGNPEDNTAHTFLSWDKSWADPKPQNKLRIYLNRTFSGRYFIGYNSNNRDSDIPLNCLIVGFENPAEASYFGLQIDHVIKTISAKITEKNN